MTFWCCFGEITELMSISILKTPLFLKIAEQMSVRTVAPLRTHLMSHFSASVKKGSSSVVLIQYHSTSIVLGI